MSKRRMERAAFGALGTLGAFGAFGTLGTLATLGPLGALGTLGTVIAVPLGALGALGTVIEAVIVVPLGALGTVIAVPLGALGALGTRLKVMSDHNHTRSTGRHDFFFGSINVCQKPPREVTVHLFCTSSDVFRFFGSNGGVGVVGIGGCRHQADRSGKGQQDGIRRKCHRVIILLLLLLLCV